MIRTAVLTMRDTHGVPRRLVCVVMYVNKGTLGRIRELMDTHPGEDLRGLTDLGQTIERTRRCVQIR